MTYKPIIFAFIAAVLWTGCFTTNPGNAPTRPNPTRPPVKPTQPGGGQPSTPTPNPSGGQNPSNPNNPPVKPTQKQLYRIAVVLPFLSKQMDAAGTVPEKSRFAAQFYGGMQIGLTEVSKKSGYPDFVVDVFDTQGTDADFQALLTNRQLEKAQVVIGHGKTSQIEQLAVLTKQRRQIMLSPESPIADLTTQHTGFLQLKPALQTHCTRTMQYLRKTKNYAPSQIILVAKTAEKDRLAYYQATNTALGGAALTEIIVPDASVNFDKVDLRKHIKAGQTTAFILPTWAGQDWVLAFLSRLKATKGNNKVEVYGMPQWINYEQLEPELMSDLNVHITSSTMVDREQENVQQFERAFYEQFGTLPDDDAYNGYDVAILVTDQLQQHGLNFPERLNSLNTFVATTRGGVYLRGHGGGVDGGTSDYLENIFVHLLKFEQYGWVRIE
jgi:hypothetical protein